MRVVAGSAGGRKLVAPEGEGTRPTSDRVRESIFNVLYSMGGVEDWSVVDLFAGSGALGIEALSRGAAHVEFVERSVPALVAVETNLATLGFESKASVTRSDSLRWVPSRPFDLALIDPPYAFDQWDELLSRKLADIIVIESGKDFRPPEDLEIIRAKRYGATVVTIVRQD
jgi:16S rRNA (guanine966-N2)-methyltransferase